MATARHRIRRTRSVRPWWRPVVYSAVAAAIGTLFTPLPALADPPTAPQAPFAPAVPDTGSRPTALGTLTMPGQRAATPTPAPLTGAATSPVLQKIEKGRTEITTLGDQLIKVGQDRDLSRNQLTIARERYTQAENALREAQASAVDAASAAVRETAAMPPGAIGSGLAGLDDLARIQRGEVDSRHAAARQLELAQITAQIALDEQTLAERRLAELEQQYNTLNGTLTRKQAAQQQLELANADELNAAEATQNAADSRLGAEYLAGAEAGRGADPRALQALSLALAQRGDPYVWSEEGPDQYDCSGLMYAAYRSVGFPLTRVSRDQYWQTRNKVVDRYSLLPGDLLFFSSSSSWRGIHHVAMYAGNGMMVEAPRTGLNVRLTPVRWSRLFQSTRIFGSVEGVTEGPILGAPDPDPTGGTTPPPVTTPPGTRPTTPPASTRPPTTPPPTTSGPPTTPPAGTPPPGTTPPGTTPPTTPPGTTPPTTAAPPTTPSAPPTTSRPSPPAPPRTSAPSTPAVGPSSTSPATGGSSSGGNSSSGNSSAGNSSSTTRSATTTQSTKESATSTKSSATSTGATSSSSTK